MRITTARSARSRLSTLAAACLWIGCASDDPEPSLAPSEPAPPPAVTPAEGAAELKLVEAVDLLLVIDNSGSMASEQTRLAAELDRLVRMLTLGDRAPDAPADADRSNKARYFNPVKDLHIGVVSTNVGGVDDAYGHGDALTSCHGDGDGGRLRSDTRIARDGVTATSSREFMGYSEGDVVVAPDPSCALPPGPSYLAFSPGGPSTAEEVIARFRCAARLGVQGCPFEQPLEAMRRALSMGPSASPFTDAAQAAEVRAHNAGFLREEALLAVVHISDEDDCSITDAGKVLFEHRPDRQDGTYSANVNLRCGLHGETEGLLQPVEAYAEALRALKPGHPERVLFSAIVGVPTDVAPGTAPDELLARPDMQFREGEGYHSGLPVPSCVRADPLNPALTDMAYPARRFVALAKQLGDGASLHSICGEDYGPALASLVDRVAPMMAP